MSLTDRAKRILRSYINSTSADDILDKAKSAVEDLFDLGGEGSTDREDIDLDRVHERLYDGMTAEEVMREYEREFGDLGSHQQRKRSRRGSGSARRPRREALAVHFRNLELKPGASYEDCKKQYRKLMKKYHPDRFAHDSKKQAWATKKSQVLGESFDAIERALKK